jgi:hypothetical protein
MWLRVSRGKYDQDLIHIGYHDPFAVPTPWLAPRQL